MLATLTFDNVIDTSVLGADTLTAGRDGQSPFSAMLAVRPDHADAAVAYGGELLPANGKPLPPIEVLSAAAAPLHQTGTGEPDALADEGFDTNDVALPALPAGPNVGGVYVPLAPVLSGESGFSVNDINLSIPRTLQPSSEATRFVASPAGSGAQFGDARTVLPGTLTQTFGRTSDERTATEHPAVRQSLIAEAANVATTTRQTANEVPIFSANPDRLRHDRNSQAAAGRNPVAAAVAGRAGIEQAEPLRENVFEPLTRAVAAIGTTERTDAHPLNIALTQPRSARFSETISQVHIAQAGIAQVGASQPSGESSLSSTDILTDSIRTPVRDTTWAEKLGERVVLLSGNQLRTADIKLTPADLGPLRVQVNVEDGAANVTFHANHPLTREAIEQALPRLREMLADSGLSLGQADVSEHGVADGKPDRDAAPRAADMNNDEAPEEPSDADVHDPQQAPGVVGLLDTFV